MSVLFLTTVLPKLKRSGGEIGAQSFIDGVARRRRAIVVGYKREGDPLEPGPDEIAIDERPIETEGAKGTAAFWMLLALARGLPYSSAKYYGRAYARAVRGLLAVPGVEAVVIDHAQIGWVLRAVRIEKPIVFNAANVEHRDYESLARTAKNPVWRWIYSREARLIREMEDRLCARSEQVWTVAEPDARYFAEEAGGGDVRVFGVPAAEERPPPASGKAYDVAIIGSWTWAVNVEGLRWFLDEVLPRLGDDLAIHVAGRGAEWLEGRHPNVTYRGFVDDAQAFLAGARVVAIPSVSGSGLLIKTLDAIASGSRVLGTPTALRGVGDPPASVTVAATPEEFARRLRELVAAPEDEDVRRAAREWSEAWRARFFSGVGDAIEEVAGSRSGP